MDGAVVIYRDGLAIMDHWSVNSALLYYGREVLVIKLEDMTKSMLYVLRRSFDGVEVLESISLNCPEGTEDCLYDSGNPASYLYI